LEAGAAAPVVVVAVVVLHRLDMLVADTQEQEEADCPAGPAGTVVQHALVVAQQESVVPCPLDDPDHIASHSNSGIPALAALAALAAVVVVLRFPLYMPYVYLLKVYRCRLPLPPAWRATSHGFARQAYHT